MSVRRTNRFWSVSLEHTLFLDFLKLFVNMRLVVSFEGKKNRSFWTYGSKVMGVWSFKEKSGQGGHVPEPTNKSWPLAQKVEGRKKKNFKKNGNCPISPGVDPQPAGDRWSLAGPGPPIGGRRPLVTGLLATNDRGLDARSRLGHDRWSLAARWPEVAPHGSTA
jgi:hypothetical protein